VIRPSVGLGGRLSRAAVLGAALAVTACGPATPQPGGPTDDANGEPSAPEPGPPDDDGAIMAEYGAPAPPDAPTDDGGSPPDDTAVVPDGPPDDGGMAPKYGAPPPPELD
jgi:hypothetical protein